MPKKLAGYSIVVIANRITSWFSITRSLAAGGANVDGPFNEIDDAKDALARRPLKPPDVVVFVIELPNEDVYTFAEELRRTYIPIAFITNTPRSQLGGRVAYNEVVLPESAGPHKICGALRRMIDEYY